MEKLDIFDRVNIFVQARTVLRVKREQLFIGAVVVN